MNEETKEATLGSIEKWKKIEDGTGEDLGTENCPLCHMFRDDDCMGCPVAEEAEEMGCGGSPYVDWEEHIHGTHREEMDETESAKVFCPKCKKLATDERKFLEGLLGHG